MHDIIKRDIISVLADLKEFLKDREDSNFIDIKKLSNRVIHNASVFQDEDSISVAILIYSLSKIMERKSDIDHGRILYMLDSCISAINENNDDAFRKSIKGIFDFIKTVDRKIRLYINEVINQSQIKKGCKLCEHGISVARASEVLGISRWELLHYLGKTTFIDQYSEPVNVLRRLKVARSLFS